MRSPSRRRQRTATAVASAGIAAAWALLAACSMRYELLKSTSLPNPPPQPVKVYIQKFPVKSKAAIIDNFATVSLQGQPSFEGGFKTNESRLAEISRPSRIEDLSGAILRELRKQEVRQLIDMIQVESLEDAREVDNPFELVAPESQAAQLEISGSAVIRSQKAGRHFSQLTDQVEFAVSVRDLQSGQVVNFQPQTAGISMLFNSSELEETMAVAVVTLLTKKTPF